MERVDFPDGHGHLDVWPEEGGYMARAEAHLPIVGDVTYYGGGSSRAEAISNVKWAEFMALRQIRDSCDECIDGLIVAIDGHLGKKEMM